MKFSKSKNILEIATNVAVLLVALVALTAFAWNYFVQSQGLILKNGLRKGQILTKLPGLDYGNAHQTLLIAMNTKCPYCNESLLFYKQLIKTRQENGIVTRIVAIFPGPEEETKEYVKQNQLDVYTVSGVDFGLLNVLGTPTLILVDDKGKLLDFWTGKVPAHVEQQIIKIIATPIT
jgi:thioredoxin-related protein